MDVHQFIEKAAGPAIVTDEANRFVDWNQAAKDLLGYDKRHSVTGRPIFELLEARDVFGNRLTAEPFAFWQMVSRGEAIKSFEFYACKASGECTRVAVSVVAVLGPDPLHYNLIYMLSPMFRRRRADEAIERILTDGRATYPLLDPSAQLTSSSPPDLTHRQLEVLRLMAQGTTVGRIADSLGVSIHTVRSHIQRILEKLDAHSQAEAVARAFRERLL